jgi:hypothetical protein
MPGSRVIGKVNVAGELSDFPGGLNGSAQHSSRTRLALKTKAKSLARVRSAGTLLWLGFDQAAVKQIGSSGKALWNQRVGGVASTV